MFRRITAVAAIAFVALTGCENSSGSGVHPALRDRIDTLAASGDCAELQQVFDDAEARGEDRRVATMEYADEAMQRAGCYD